MDRDEIGGPTGPVVVVGAARSGTKLLRSVVAVGDEFAAVPFDVNYIWRHRRPSGTDDRIPPDAATPSTVAAIRRRLAAAAGAEDGTRRLVEKTVSNTLRLPFVRGVLPEACFIHIRRDGRDVAESARRCWRQRPDVGRLLPKLRTLGVDQLFSYGLAYVRQQIGRLLHLESHVRSWGPRYPGIDEDVARLPLLDVCFRQWEESVRAVERDTRGWDDSVLLTVDYEEFVRDPRSQAARIAEFVGARTPSQIIEAAVTLTERGNVGKYQRLPAAEREHLDELLARHNAADLSS